MNILSKKDFCGIMYDMEQHFEFQEKLNDVFREFNQDVCIVHTNLENTVVEILEIIFDDKENQWISYWVWEEEFGQKYKKGDVTEEDGTIIPLETAGDLYDFLIKNKNNKNRR